MKKILYIDMDGVLADFNSAATIWLNNNPDAAHLYKGWEDHIHGIFRDLNLIEGALWGVNQLYNSNKYDMFIATAAPWSNPQSLSDKRYWIEKHFGDIFRRKMFVTHRKDLLMGDYLIDDRIKNGAGDFKGELILFGGNQYPDWNAVLKKLL